MAAIVTTACSPTNGGLNSLRSSYEEVLSAISDIDQVSPLGFPASDVIAFAARDYTTSLLWASPDEVAFGPESGRRALEIQVSYHGGPIVFVHSRPRSDGLDVLRSCPDRMRIAVTVRLRTENGALDETFDASLETASNHLAKLTQPLDLEALSGTFEITPPEGRVVQLGLAATFSPLGTTGQLTSFVEVRHGSGPNAAVSGRMVRYATWPADPACRTQRGEGLGLAAGLDLSFAGVSAREGLTQFNGVYPMPLDWRNGSRTRLALIVVPTGDGCVGFGDGGSGQQAPLVGTFPVNIVAMTDDGRLYGEYAAALQLRPATGGGFDSASTLTEMALPVDQLATSGLSGIGDVTPYNSLSFVLFSQVTRTMAAGEVTLRGLTRPPCLTQPVQSSGGMTSGCEGTRFTEIERGNWQTPSNP
jgi:hypothetical protein